MSFRQARMLLAFAAVWGASFLFIRVTVDDLGAVALADGRLLLAALALAPFVARGLRRSAPLRKYLLLGAVNAALPFTPDAGDLAALAALAILSTSFAYLLYFRLVAEVGPTSTLTVTFLVPVFGVLWAAIFLGEHVGLGTVLGGALILVSVAFVTNTTFSRRGERLGEPDTRRAVAR